MNLLHLLAVEQYSWSLCTLSEPTHTQGEQSQHHITKINVFILESARYLNAALLKPLCHHVDFRRIAQSLSLMIWYCQALSRLLFLAYSPIFPIVWHWVYFWSQFQQHEAPQSHTKLSCYNTSVAAFIIRSFMVMIQHWRSSSQKNLHLLKIGIVIS